MSVYTIYSSISLELSPKEAWDFLSNPANLIELTPPRFKMKSLKGSDREFFSGAMYGFSLQPFPGYRAKWLSEITHIENQKRFTDVQWEGPYAFWHHVHEVRATDEGGSELIDRVFYKMPLGILGSLLHGPLVRPGLKETFQYRHLKLSERFGQIEERPAQIVFKSL